MSASRSSRHNPSSSSGGEDFQFQGFSPQIIPSLTENQEASLRALHQQVKVRFRDLVLMQKKSEIAQREAHWPRMWPPSG